MQLMNMRLAHERKRAREFEVLRREAEEANIAKSTFLATMSHELRTPLNAIIGFSDLIMSEAFGPIRPARYVEYVKDICISGRHLLALVNDILDMAKIEAGEVDLDLQSISPDELCVVVMRILAPNTEKAGHEVVNLLPPLLPDLWVDERCGRQILMNLMSNAIKFTPSGGRIEVGGQREGDQVALWVRDNGIGIAAADIDKVMRPFGQVESALARQYQGTGLGLPLVAKMADAMGGSFTLASELGTGTTATVRFNVSQSAAPGLFAFG
jgi:two-component system cell cycle sensor histidine kinase PleC